MSSLQYLNSQQTFEIAKISGLKNKWSHFFILKKVPDDKSTSNLYLTAHKIKLDKVSS